MRIRQGHLGRGVSIVGEVRPIVIEDPRSSRQVVEMHGEIHAWREPVTFGPTGGLKPYTWKLITAAPAGLKLSSSDTLSGTPAKTLKAKTNTFKVQVTDQLIRPGLQGPDLDFRRDYRNVHSSLATWTIRHRRRLPIRRTYS